MATRDGQTILIEESNADSLSIRLDDSMCDLDQPITIKRGNEIVCKKIIPRTITTIAKTLQERGDPTATFSAEVSVPAGNPPTNPTTK